VGAYDTYTGESGFYADAVVQSGRHRYTVEQPPGGGSREGVTWRSIFAVH